MKTIDLPVIDVATGVAALDKNGKNITKEVKVFFRMNVEFVIAKVDTKKCRVVHSGKKNALADRMSIMMGTLNI